MDHVFISTSISTFSPWISYIYSGFRGFRYLAATMNANFVLAYNHEKFRMKENSSPYETQRQQYLHIRSPAGSELIGWHAALD